MTHNIIKTDNYLLVVDDSEIAIGDTVLVDCSELEVLDIRKVNDYYNEQFLFEGNGQIHMDYCKKIISHLPLNNSPVLEGVDLLPPLEDDVEKLADDLYPIQIEDDWDKNKQYRDEFIEGYNKAKEKYKYTEEDLREALFEVLNTSKEEWCATHTKDSIVRRVIKSLQQPKTPVAFECEMVTMNKGYTEESDYPYQQCDIPKTTTNSQGFTQWVGQYIY